jgi:hypothetical protein
MNTHEGKATSTVAELDSFPARKKEAAGEGSLFLQLQFSG